MKDRVIESLCAGLVIGLGGVAFLTAETKILGAFLFSAGLIAVLTLGYDLYTGKVCYIENYTKGLYLPKVLVLNLIAATAIGLASYWLKDAAYTVASNKASMPVVAVFLRSIMCGMFISIGVRGYKYSGQIIVPIVAVMGFILSGSEHVIADMYYFAAARMFNISTLIFILVAAVGNTIGGLLLCERGFYGL